MRTGIVNHLRGLAEQFVDGAGIDEVEGVNFFHIRLGRLISGVEPSAPGFDTQESYRGQNGHQGYHNRPSMMLPEEGGLDFRHILESFSGIVPQATADNPSLFWKQQSDHFSKRPNVSPVVDRTTRNEFWSGETSGPGWPFENRPGVSVGKPEVNEFEIVPVVGYEYVGWFDVPVDDLFGMEIAQGVTELGDNLPASDLVGQTFGKKIVEGDSVNPFHLDAVAESGNIFKVIDFPDCGVGETIADLVFFPEEGFVTSLSSEAWLQGFEGPESSVFVDEPDFAPACGGGVDEAGRWPIRSAMTGRVRSAMTGRVRQAVTVCGGVRKESGIFWHEFKDSVFC